MTAKPPEVPTVSLTVDGRAIEAQEGELVIAAAERNDVYIPRFCWHSRMNPVGMCRMCLVEVDTGRGPALQPSCMIECTDGMSIETQSPVVVKAQEGVLEFLLINHPLDCPVCDKGGECPLQDQTMSHGPGESRYVEEKRHTPKPIPVSDLVLLDRERCILCDRCTRFAKEVAGDAFVFFMERGNETEINTFPEHPFSPYFSGNTVQLCPVGALTSTTYRFKARPWDLAQVESTCTGCSVGCRIVVDSSRDEVLRYHGVDSEPVNWTWLCDRGRYGFEAIEKGDRLTNPVMRRDAQAEPEQVRWNDALAATATAIREGLDRSGPRGLALLGGANLTNEAQFTWAKLAKGMLGTDNVDAQLGDGLDPRLVFGLPRATIAETCTPGGTILVVANDVKEELGVLFLRLRQAAVWDGATLIEVSATDNSLTAFATASLRARPGQSPALLEALLNGGPAPEDVDADAFATARDRLTAGGPLRVVLGRPSLAESADVTALAAHQILAARPDATFLTTLRRGNIYGALDMGLTPGFLPGRVSLADGRNAVADGWGIAANELPTSPGLDARGILEAAADGKIDTLVLLGADPVADFGDRALAERALAGARFVIAVDIFPNESNRLADVILPASGFAAEDGTTTNLEGRVSRVTQRVAPKGNTHADWVIAAELAFALRADLGLESVEEVRAEIARTAPSHSGMTEALLDGDGVVFPVPVDPEFVTEVSIADDAISDENANDNEGLPADDVRIVEEPAPSTEAARRALLVELPAAPGLEVPTLDAYSFRLVVTRKMYDQGSLVQQAPHLGPLATPAGEVPVRLNPADLARLGVEGGARVKVTSAKGQVTIVAVADEGVPRGIAAIVHDQSASGASVLIDADQAVTDVHVETLP